MKPIFVILFIILSSNILWAQSEQEKLTWCKIHKKKSTEKLDSNFVYIRGFEICGLDCGCKKPPPEYKLLLEEGIEYEVRISNWRGNICAVLKNASKRTIAQSFRGHYHDGFKFKCRETGVYYLQFNTPPPFSHYTMIGGASLAMKNPELSSQNTVPVKKTVKNESNKSSQNHPNRSHVRNSSKN